MKKMILAISLIVAVAGMAFAASVYKYHYILSVHCRACHQYQSLEVDKNTDELARSYGRDNFSNHSTDCTKKNNTAVNVSITSKSSNE